MPQTPTRADLVHQTNEECIMTIQNIPHVKESCRGMKVLENILEHLEQANGELLNYWA